MGLLDEGQARCHVYYALISTGAIVFCVHDWGRGFDEIHSRARGYIASRRPKKLVYARSSAMDISDECYPDAASAVRRWSDFSRIIEQGKNLWTWH